MDGFVVPENSFKRVSSSEELCHSQELTCFAAARSSLEKSVEFKDCSRNEDTLAGFGFVGGNVPCLGKVYSLPCVKISAAPKRVLHSNDNLWARDKRNFFHGRGQMKCWSFLNALDRESRSGIAASRASRRRAQARQRVLKNRAS